MAASVVIQLTLDDKGVMTGLRSVGGELDGLKTRAATGAQGAGQALDGLDKNTQRNIDSARLLESTLGVALPRTLTKIIGQSEAFGNVLSAAFNFSVVAAMAAAVVVVGGKIADAALEWGGYTKAMQEAYAANVKANLEQLGNPRTPEIARQSLAMMKEQREKNDEIIAAQEKENELAEDFFDIGAKGVATASERVALEKELQKVELERDPLLRKMAELEFAAGTAVSKAQAAAGAAGLQGYAALAQQHSAALDELSRALSGPTPMGQGQYDAMVTAENQKYSRLLGALAEQNAETTRKLREQVVQGWLQGDDLILAKEQALEAALGDIAKHTGDTDADLEARRVLYREQADQETLAALRKRVAAEVEITDQFHAQTLEIEDRANAREIEGSYKLYADEKAQRDKNLQDYKAALDKEQKETSDYDQLQAARKKLSLDLDARNDAAKKERIEGLAKLQEKAALETQQIEMQAAIAIAPPWERADMEIYASAAQRIREINDLKQRGLIFDTDVAARTAAVWQESAGKVLDSWTSTFEELFSGGWSNYIQNLAHKFMARIAAELTLSSGLSEVLGPILGLPSGVPGMTNAGFGTTFGGGTSSLAALLGMGATGGGSTTAGASSMIGLGLTPFSGAGAIGPGGMLGGAGNTGSYNVNAVNQLLGIPTLTGVPALSGAGSLAGGGGSGLLSIAGLQSMLPLAGLFLGGKLGGTAGTIGGGLAGLMAYLGLKYIGLQGAASWGASSSAMWGGAAGGLLAGAAGGLLGFGIGQQYGTIPGTLGGAGSGALLGLMFGGPVGAIIGGILGLLGGIFGGMFGGSARTKAARQFADEQKAAADQIEAQFKSFQLDYPTALADLEQIKSNAWEQLRKLKDEGKKEYGRDLEPYVNKIEGELKGYEDERERRSTLAFAPPQFAGGGYTGEGAYGGWGLPPGAAGIVHPREYVFDEPTTARIGRGALDRMNAGASVGGDVHIWNINTLDPRNFATWLKQGGGDVLATYVRGRRLEGRSF